MQMRQLGRSGEARQMGVASFCRVACVTKTHKAGASDAKRLRLNVEGSDYVLADEAPVFFGRLLAASQECAGIPKITKPGDLDDTISHLQDFVDKAVPSPRRGADATGYVRSFLVRCLLVSRWRVSPSMPFDWRQVPLSTIMKAVPDQRAVLSAFPETWSAAEVSAFCWGRSDRIWYVPIFGCLWGKCASRFGKDIVLLAATQEFCNAAAAFIQQHGFSAHPGTLVEQFGRVASAWPTSPHATILARAGQ